ncbi:MAG: hypothetical protein R2911_24225 [Caldilineaceae bacterium]
MRNLIDELADGENGVAVMGSSGEHPELAGSCAGWFADDVALCAQAASNDWLSLKIALYCLKRRRLCAWLLVLHLDDWGICARRWCRMGCRILPGSLLSGAISEWRTKPDLHADYTTVCD